VEEDVFRALADSTRRELLDRLYTRNGQTLGQLSDQMAMTRQAVSQHLAILEAANLVVALRRGREKLHYLNPVPIAEIYDRWIRKYERQRMEALTNLKSTLMNEEEDE
jgi:DNA-binding transcriptional ArsR family regulator